jgi:hypothetical protein
MFPSVFDMRVDVELGIPASLSPRGFFLSQSPDVRLIVENQQL